jgi:hypothetical protein
MNTPLRHRCRNPKCRTKLKEPVGNEHKAFCCRGCFENFYRTKCIVCERDIGTDPLTGEKRKRHSKRKFCGRTCRAEAKHFPHAYAWVLLPPVRSTINSRSAHSTGLKFGLMGEPLCLRTWWWWWGDGSGDYSLYDRDGLTIARVVQLDDSRYYLRTPIVISQQSWVGFEGTKRGAEGFALMAMPLEAKLAARIKRNNATPHPMGSPPNRSFDIGDGVLHGAGSKITEAKVSGDPGDIPNFLRRRPCEMKP